MIKIDETHGESIMGIANKCLEQKKRQKIASSILMKTMIGISVSLGCINLFINSIGAVSLLISALTLYMSSDSLKRSTKNAIKYLCNEIVCIVNLNLLKTSFDNDKLTDNDRSDIPTIDNIDSEMTLDIVPKNIQIGWDLEAANAVPIFKEGKYVIVKSDMHPIFLRVFEKDEEETYLMEPIEEDIRFLEEELPEYEKYIQMLKLQSREFNTKRERYEKDYLP